MADATTYVVPTSFDNRPRKRLMEVAVRRKQNPVARHATKYNLAHVMRDRKKDAKRGYRKHKQTKGSDYES